MLLYWLTFYLLDFLIMSSAFSKFITPEHALTYTSMNTGAYDVERLKKKVTLEHFYYSVCIHNQGGSKRKLILLTNKQSTNEP